MVMVKHQRDDLADKMLKLVVPIAIQQFMLSLVSATDALMLGFVDQTSLFRESRQGAVL